MPNVSVVIPTYNRANLIARSIRSVLDQTVEPLEVIVVDDGSKDDTKKIIEAMNEPKVKYIYQENGGAASARNRGVQECKGDWIAFHDSDDVWHADKLEKQLNYAKEHPEYDLIYSSYCLIMPNGMGTNVPYVKDREILEGDIYLPLLVMNTIGTPTILVKTEEFLSIGGFNSELRCIEDWDFAIRFSQNHKIGFVSEVLVDAYRVDLSVSSNLPDMFDIRCRVLTSNKDVLLKYNLFDTAVGNLFKMAEESHCLEMVQKMFMLYLQRQ